MNSSITFVAPEIYSLISKGNSHYGGAEVQQLLIAEELQKNGYPVYFITFSDHNYEILYYNNIKIFVIPRFLKILRIFNIFARFYNLWITMRKIDSSNYYLRVPSIMAFYITIFCKIYNKNFLFATANDRHCNNDIYQLLSKTRVELYKYSLKNAYRVITQTRKQKFLIKEYFNTESIIIPNIVRRINITHNSMNNYILWVGTISEKKQPHLLIDLAKNNSAVKFIIVGGRNKKNPDYSEIIINEFSKISNIDYYGPVSYNEMHNIYIKGLILLNTSTSEGFPNTYLEAWMHNMPVITCFDPDNIIFDNKLGIVFQDASELDKIIKDSLSNNLLIKQLGNNGRNYVEKYHTSEKIISLYEKLIFH